MLKEFLKCISKPISLIYCNITKSLKYKLIIFFVIVSIIPIIITGGIINKMTSAIFVEKVTQDSTEMMMKEVYYFDSYFKEVNNILSLETSSVETLGFLKDVDESNLKSMDSIEIVDKVSAQLEYLISLKTDIVNSIMVLPLEKNRYPISRGRYNYITGFKGDYRDSEIFKRTLNSKNLVEWIFSKHTDSDQYFVSASSSISNHTDIDKLGIAVVFLNLDQIKGIFESSKSQQDEKILVLDKSNSIIYDTDTSKVGEKYDNPTLLSKIGNSSSGNFNLELNGVRSIVVFYTSVNTGWKIINIVPYENIAKNVKILSKATVWIALMSLIFTSVVAILFYLNLYNPIKKLSASMDKVGEGNFKIYLETKKTDEIGILINRFNYMASSIATLIHNVKEEQRLKKENEIKALQSQITPHFLYNTLNSVKTLIVLGRNNDADNMIIALINLLKTCARNTNKFVTIQEELNYVKNYVLIMEYRNDKKLIVSYDIDFKLLECQILKFTLQPIIENCIIHAFDNTDRENIIKIGVYRNSEAVEISIQDNGIGMPNDMIDKYINNKEEDSKFRFNNIGINNINERIKLNHSSEYGINIDSTLGEGTTVLIRIPYIEAE